MKGKGFTLVELMVVVAIIALLAAVALPAYSTSRQKAKASLPLAGLKGAKAPLQDWFSDNLSFAGISGPERGGSLRRGTTKLGSGLVQIDHLRWEVSAIDANTLQVTWDFENPAAGCPDAACDGTWTLTCSDSVDLCLVNATVGEAGDNRLGLDITSNMGALTP